MSKYRFMTTDITTGKLLGSELPIVGQSASMQINGIGSFSGALQLLSNDTPVAIRRANIAAIEPWKCVLWVLQDNYPVWAGPITGWQPSSAQDGSLQFQAATMESILQYRILRDQAVQYSVVAGSGTSPRTAVELASPQISSFLPVIVDESASSSSSTTYLTYDVIAGTDVFDLVRSVGRYAIGKAITDAANVPISIPSSAVHVASMQVATNNAGITVLNSGDVKIDPNQGQSCYDLINSLSSTYGFEWCVAPGLTSTGNLALTLQLGYPRLGRSFTAAGLQFTYPSRNVVDYVWTRQAQTPTNAVYATGTDDLNTLTVLSKYPYGFDINELSTGYPLLELATALPTPTSSTASAAQGQANAYAAGQVLTQSVLGQMTPSVTLGADAYPKLYDLMMGDDVMLTATSQLHPADANTGAPGLQVLTRMISWTLSFPSASSAETVQVMLSALTPVSA